MTLGRAWQEQIKELRSENVRLQAAKRAALKVADERTMQNTALRQTLGECEKERNYYFKLCSERIDEIERLTAALKICGAPFDTGPTSVNGAACLIADEFERRMNVAANTLNDGTVPGPYPAEQEV